MERRHRWALATEWYLKEFLDIELPPMDGEESMTKEQLMDELHHALGRYFPHEDIITGSRTELRLEQYTVNKIREVYGLTFDEFVELPLFEVEERLRLQRNALARDRRLASIAANKAKHDLGNDKAEPFGMLDV